MWITRYYETEPKLFRKGKVNLIYGPRRVGKTALIKKLLKNIKGKIFSGEGDDIELRRILSSENKMMILSAFRNYDFIFIDEAQRIKNIGWGLKILVDNLPQSIIIASGSSSFRLSSQVGEPLTGRNITRHLFPISLIEINNQFGGMHIYQNLEHYLIFGFYPECLTATDDQNKILYLRQLRNSYLLKDILEMESIRNSDILYDLLKLIAFQIGSEVSMNELGNALGISKHTVRRYLDLLEKSFIIKKLNGYSNNLRKEITKSSRYYFYDNGLRNVVINNFNALNDRNDVGMLWENFMVMERIKKQHYSNLFSNNYFWRTYNQKEVDFVEEREGNLYGYEFKWNPARIKTQNEWLKIYPNAEFKVIHKDNFLKFAI